MNNYIYIDGKKIEISEETANNLKEKFSEKSPYEFEESEQVWFLRSDCWLIKDFYSYIKKDNRRTTQGNIFRTKEKAEHERDKREAIFKIKKYIYDNFGYCPTDWADWNGGNYKYYIMYRGDYDVFSYEMTNRYKRPTLIGYLKTEEQAEEIINNFKDELRIIFSI